MNFKNELKNFDNSFLSGDIYNISGVDEAGRGPLAGPVVAAAVIFDKGLFIDGVNDSKKLSPKKRNELYIKIISSALSYGVGIIDNEEIDKINILQASLKAMKIAVDKLSTKPDLILIDGNKSFHSSIKTKTVVKGDSKSFAIAAASIIAKVTRDEMMVEAAKQYPAYFWQQNKGYPTKIHREAVIKHGPTPLHRKTFLKNLLPVDQLFQ
jgi:ribonuclease HII